MTAKYIILNILNLDNKVKAIIFFTFAPMIAYNKHILSNGIVFLHHYDGSTPFVVVNTMYNIGAKHEDENRTGFAHLFEHLMFGGSTQIPDFDDELQIAGGENNAFTNNDFTNYYDIVPKENVETALWLEADRMQNLAINPTSLEVQRKVVCEEFKEHYISQPYGDVWHILREMTYLTHPYKWPTIGKSLKHVEDATLEDVSSFYNKYYAPCNATLVLAGNITNENALLLAEKWMGKVEKSGLLPKEDFVEAEQMHPVEKTVFADVPLNAIYLAFKIPSRLEKGYYIADIISDLLSGGTSSRLYQKLVKELRLFINIDAYITGSHDIGLFVIEGKLSNDVDAKAAKDVIFEELQKLIDNKIADDELRKVKNKMLTYMQFSDTSLLNKAISLAYYASLKDIDRINNEEEYYEAITSEDISIFCKNFFTKEKSNILYYLKK